MDDSPGSPSTSTTGRRSRLVPSISLYIVLFFILLMCVIGIAWLIMNPDDPSFRVGSLSVSNFSVSDSHLRGTSDIIFTISNPNKKIDMHLDEFHVVLCYGEVELSGGTDVTDMTKPIYLGRTKKTNLKVDMVLKADSPKLVKKKNKKVFAEVDENWRKGVVNLNVRIEVRVRFESGNWPTRLKLLDLHCGDLDVFFDRRHKDAGKLLGIGKDCHG